MLDFKEITLADRQWMQPLFERSNFRSEEYSFSFCYLWKDVFTYKAARMQDYLIIEACHNKRPPSYLFPAGSGDVSQVVDALIHKADRTGNPLVFHTVLAEQAKLLEVLYPGRFEFLDLTDYYDYVYDAQSLIHLQGKKLHAKRNHINRFIENNPDWRYEPITPENLPEVVLMNAEWCAINGCNESKTMRDEACSVRNALQSFFALELDGGLIRTEAGGRVVAFSIGDRLNSDTYLVHIEKAFSDVQGAYAIINQQFTEHNCEDYLYVDREDDSGQEGLRKAKQSYRPVLMVEKFGAKLKC